MFSEFCEALHTHDAKAAADFKERLAARTRTQSQV